jgi:hypothetical protein
MNRVARLALGIALAAMAATGCDGSSGSSQTPAPAVAKAKTYKTPAAPLAAPQAQLMGQATTGVVEDRSVGAGLTALQPIRDGALIVVPIVADSPAHAPRYLTLDEGMRKGVVSVREMGEVDYNRLVVSNSSNQTLCVMAGELILDGHQDRTFAETLAFAPHEREDVPVMCVEPDRDDGPSKRFRSGNAMVHLDLRRQLYQGTQSSVWEEVRRYNRAHDIYNETSTYRTAAARQATEPQQTGWRERVMTKLASLPERDRVVGLAVSLEGRLVSVDVFATPHLYNALEPKLLGSFVAQAIDSHREIRNPRPVEIKELLATATKTECGSTAMSTPAAPAAKSDRWE